MTIRQFGGIKHIPRLSDLSVITCEYGLVDVDIAMVGHASEFWEAQIEYRLPPLF